MQGINPMGISAPWDDSYLNYRNGPPNFDHLSLPTKPLFTLDWTPVSDKKTLITIHLRISYLCCDNDDK